MGKPGTLNLSLPFVVAYCLTEISAFSQVMWTKPSVDVITIMLLSHSLIHTKFHYCNSSGKSGDSQLILCRQTNSRIISQRMQRKEGHNHVCPESSMNEMLKIPKVRKRLGFEGRQRQGRSLSSCPTGCRHTNHYTKGEF